MDHHLFGNTTAFGQRQGALIGCRLGRGLGVVDESVDGVEFYFGCSGNRGSVLGNWLRESENAFG